jgi:hypothetical protein
MGNEANRVQGGNMNAKETVELLIDSGLRKIDVAKMLDIHRNSLNSLLTGKSRIHPKTRDKLDALAKCLSHFPPKVPINQDSLAIALRRSMGYSNIQTTPENPNNRIEEINQNLNECVGGQADGDSKHHLILIVAEKDTLKEEVAIHLKIAIQIKFSKNANVVSDEEYYQYIRTNPLPDKTIWYMGDNAEKRSKKFCYKFEKYTDSILDLTEYAQNINTDVAYIRTSPDESFVIVTDDLFWQDGGETLYRLTDIYVDNYLNFNTDAN